MDIRNLIMTFETDNTCLVRDKITGRIVRKLDFSPGAYNSPWVIEFAPIRLSDWPT